MTDQHHPEGEQQESTPMAAAEQTEAQSAGASTHDAEPQMQAPEAVRSILPQLEGELDEDAEMDAAEEGEDEDEDEFIDAGQLFAMLNKLQETLDEQSKEIRGLRREMRELRESQSAGAPAAGRDSGERGGFRPREDRGERSGGGVPGRRQP